ncbi:DUF5837 family cyanobactin class RiPP [Spirulina sp. CCNP1310]|jgi:bacteriocin leader peptide (microcyclamide/patellamide family)|uniref:DUF5837 family cyanobactin class RiPP n=1 Tax=Spirulina sp. CCNP1310 TaxID=3110249 RepID=UPI003A4C5A83
MDKKNISPNPQQPVDRVPSGQLPSALAELSEESLGSQALACGSGCFMPGACDRCSYDGDDE